MELEFGNSVKCEERTGASGSFTAANINSSSFGEEVVGCCVNKEVQGRGDEHMISLANLNPYILCSICKGYFIDATTITECLHTFCKSCIVRHFYYSNRCPKCNVVVHQTQPLYNIRLDRQLQDIVFKVVENLEEREKKQMYDFYRERGLEMPKPDTVVPQSVPTARGRPKKLFGPLFHIPPELDVSLLLEFIGADEGTGSFKGLFEIRQNLAIEENAMSHYLPGTPPPRFQHHSTDHSGQSLYTLLQPSVNKDWWEHWFSGSGMPLEKKFVRVSGEATIGHVEKFLRRKMELGTSCQVDIICADHLLEHCQTLREILAEIGKSAIQDGLLVLHFGLGLSSSSLT